jgi:protein-disulfide isomerase
MARRPLALIAGLAALVASGAYGAMAAPGGDPTIAAHAAGLLNDRQTQTLGHPQGDVTIVEFFDYACPFCKAAEPRIEALLKQDKGVRLVVKEFPVLGPDSVVASRAALAAARQGRYAAFHQALLLHHGGLDEPAIFEVAHDVGLDVQRLKRDMADPAITAEIQANLKLAHDIHVPGTPTFIVDNRIVTQPSSSLDFVQLARASREGRKGA